MTTGVPRDQQLTKAKETWLLDCRAAGLSAEDDAGLPGRRSRRSSNTLATSWSASSGPIMSAVTLPHYLSVPATTQAETFSSHSLLKHYAVIRTWIRWMYAQKIIEERITDYVKPPRLSTRLPSILTDQEVDAILGDLKKAGRFRDYVIFELFLDTGIRLQEVRRPHH